MSEIIPVPTEVTQAVEEYVFSEHFARDNKEDRSPLDESGIWELHRVAARIYAMGFEGGTRVQAQRSRADLQRARAAGLQAG
ncbi:hypothetical protein B7435_30100 [Mycolicibacterium peregrinum]|uniref:hypothetical protein n=1 Tax=Mycolicibacterium peregrinum TaxID=43304 RepID=UPI000B4AA230|nr:hypothetical protein [Mycolicibacterium peregrinum]OWL95541.1 hypothetical protein B7435_30100 [Mycolicibacterium peregrinum]